MKEARPKPGCAAFFKEEKHELHPETTLKQSAMSSIIISSFLLTASVVVILICLTQIPRKKKMDKPEQYAAMPESDENEEGKNGYGKESDKWEQTQTSNQTEPLQGLKANFDVVRMVEDIMLCNNCTYSIDRFKELHIFSFKYQASHFYISCKDNDPFIEIVYPTIYSAELIELNLIRRNCNKINSMWTMVKACYDIDGVKNKISVELRSTLLLCNDKRRNTEAAVEVLGYFFSIYKNFFIWLNNEKDVSRKCEAGDIDLYISHNERMDSMIAEQEISHQKKQLPFRPNNTDKLTLGQMLATFLDIKSPNYGHLQVVLDNGEVTTIDDAQAIDSFDILSPFHSTSADRKCPPREFVTLNVSLTSPEQEGHPVEYEKARKAVVSIIMNKVSSDSTTAYVRTMLVTTSMRPLSQYHDGHQETMSKSFLLPLDFADSSKKLAEFRYLKVDASDKINEGKASTLTEKQRIITEEQDLETAYCLYWGTAYYESKLYYAALLLLENAWATLNARYPSMNKQQREQFYHVCFLIGFCYTELRLYKKAYFYLDILFPLNNFQYTCEYINCLVNSKDFRAINIINSLLGQMELTETLDHNEQSEVHRSFVNFLKRRKAYVLIDQGKLDEAEIMLVEMLDYQGSSDFALGELAYIQELRKKNATGKEDGSDIKKADSDIH